ncbi:hypothetical protein Hdeb2414_s0016g00494451 [Helianthus debilis subsp. tardiflorus]
MIDLRNDPKSRVVTRCSYFNYSVILLGRCDNVLRTPKWCLTPFLLFFLFDISVSLVKHYHRPYRMCLLCVRPHWSLLSSCIPRLYRLRSSRHLVTRSNKSVNMRIPRYPTMKSAINKFLNLYFTLTDLAG